MERQCEPVSDDPQSHQPGSHQTDQLRQKNSSRKSDQQGDNTAPHILCQKKHKQPVPRHSHHQIHPELMPAPFQLELAGKVDQKEQDDQRKHIKHGDH